MAGRLPRRYSDLAGKYNASLRTVTKPKREDGRPGASRRGRQSIGLASQRLLVVVRLVLVGRLVGLLLAGLLFAGFLDAGLPGGAFLLVRLGLAALLLAAVVVFIEIVGC